MSIICIFNALRLPFRFLAQSQAIEASMQKRLGKMKGAIKYAAVHFKA